MKKAAPASACQADLQPAHQQIQEQPVEQMDHEDRRHVRGEIEPEGSAHQRVIEMAGGAEVVAVEGGLQKPGGVFREMPRGRPCKRVEFIVLEEAVIGAVIEADKTCDDQQTGGGRVETRDLLIVLVILSLPCQFWM